MKPNYDRIVADLITSMPGQGTTTSRVLITLAAALVVAMVIAPFFID